MYYVFFSLPLTAHCRDSSMIVLKTKIHTVHTELWTLHLTNGHLPMVFWYLETAKGHLPVVFCHLETDVEPVIIQPYFPCGLATLAENPLDFNFTVFLYDSLRLPFGLFPEDDQHEVEFDDLHQCRLYCLRYMEWRARDCMERGLEPDHSQQRRAQLSKETMFQQAGDPLGVTVRSGNERFDNHLDQVCLNVHWSDISAQFTHGFPRRLITSSHRGILAGNITVAARISNQAIRSLSEGN